MVHTEETCHSHRLHYRCHVKTAVAYHSFLTHLFNSAQVIGVQ